MPWNLDFPQMRRRLRFLTSSDAIMLRGAFVMGVWDARIHLEILVAG
jgi:hypothetical protein